MGLKTPVRIRGKVYSSQVEASKALGVSLARIQRALNNGTIERMDVTPYNPCIPVTLGGRTYNSIREASKATGFTIRRISYHLKRGTLDDMVAGRIPSVERRAIILNGNKYSSIAEAISETGIGKSRIYNEINRTAQKNTLCPIINLSTTNIFSNTKIPVYIDKVNYESLSDAAETYGVSLSNIRKRRERDTLDRWDRRFAPIPVTLNGERFESLAAVGRAYGHLRSTVHKRYKRGTLHKLKRRPLPDAKKTDQP